MHMVLKMSQRYEDLQSAIRLNIKIYTTMCALAHMHVCVYTPSNVVSRLPDVAPLYNIYPNNVTVRQKCLKRNYLLLLDKVNRALLLGLTLKFTQESVKIEGKL